MNFRIRLNEHNLVEANKIVIKELSSSAALASANKWKLIDKNSAHCVFDQSNTNVVLIKSINTNVVSERANYLTSFLDFNVAPLDFGVGINITGTIDKACRE
jgi:hypothetical protein